MQFLDVCAAVGMCLVSHTSQLNVDVNAYQRRFTHEIRRLEELERKLRYVCAMMAFSLGAPSSHLATH